MDNSRRKLAWFFGVVAAVCVASLAVGPVGNWYLRTRTRSTLGPSLEGTQALDVAFAKRASDAVVGVRRGVQHASGAPQLTLIYLYYIPKEEGIAPPRVSGFELKSVTWFDMEYLSEAPYSGYFVVLAGRRTPAKMPTVTVGGRTVALRRRQGSADVLDNLGDPAAFYDARLDHVPPISKVPPPSCARVFLPTPGEKVGGVRATGLPVYEADFYLRGEWLGTYGVWRTAPDAHSASISKEASQPTG